MTQLADEAGISLIPNRVAASDLAVPAVRASEGPQLGR